MQLKWAATSPSGLTVIRVFRGVSARPREVVNLISNSNRQEALQFVAWLICRTIKATHPGRNQRRSLCKTLVLRLPHYTLPLRKNT